MEALTVVPFKMQTAVPSEWQPWPEGLQEGPINGCGQGPSGQQPSLASRSSQDLPCLNRHHRPLQLQPHLASHGRAAAPDKQSWSSQSCKAQFEEDPPSKRLSAELYTLCTEGHLGRALHVLCDMDQQGIVPSDHLYLSLLKLCIKSNAATQVKEVYEHITRNKSQLSGSLGQYLVIALIKCRALEDAMQIFHELPHRTVFLWTAVISAHVDRGRCRDALVLYGYMQDEGVHPDAYTYTSLLKACGSIPDPKEGRKLHAEVRGNGYMSDVFIGSTLVSMYSKCGSLVEAEIVFTELLHRNIVSWNAMISAYVDSGQGEKAVRLYRQMLEEGMAPDKQTLVFALQACSLLGEAEDVIAVKGCLIMKGIFEIGQALHSDAQRAGFALDITVGSSLVTMYGKCLNMVRAEDAFSGLRQHDIVSWSAMLSAYNEQGKARKALQLYRQLQVEGMRPDQQTLVIALQACCILKEMEKNYSNEGCLVRIASLEIGQALHADAQKMGFASHLFVGSALVGMYGTCGTIADAENIFTRLSQRNDVTWHAMLRAYVEQRQFDKALQFFRQIQKEFRALNDVTLLCALQSCSEIGYLDLCRELHFAIVSDGCHVNSLLTTTLIHAYGNCASMFDAKAVFDALPQPDVASWNACIAGYAREGNISACLQMFEEMQTEGLQPNNVTFCSLLSACSQTGIIDKGVQCFESMSIDYRLTPDWKHYVCIIDLLGRAGDFSAAYNILLRMPMQADFSIWLCLLSACRTHGNIELGKHAFDHAAHLQTKEPGAYVLMSNIISDSGLLDGSLEHDEEDLQADGSLAFNATTAALG